MVIVAALTSLLAYMLEHPCIYNTDIKADLRPDSETADRLETAEESSPKFVSFYIMYQLSPMTFLHWRSGTAPFTVFLLSLPAL